MDSTSTLSLTVALYVLAFIARLEANPDPVTLEAMCSADSAGVRWTVPDITNINTLLLSFSCTDTNETELMDVATNNCFHELGGLPSFNQFSDRSRTHVIGRTLQPGTVCTFTAKAETTFFVSAITQANCTVGPEDSTFLLPASCDFDQNDNTCQCSCSLGFTGRADSQIDGTTCEAIAVNQSSVTTHQMTSIHSSSVSSVIMSSPEVTPTSIRGISYNGASLSSGSELGMSIKTSVSSLKYKSSTVINTTPVVSSHPTTQSPSMPSHSLIMAVSSIAVAFLFILASLTLFCLGMIVYRRYKRQRLHTKLALPFTELRFEKIDPDFNPVKIDKMVFVSESMHSIFHTFGSLDPPSAIEQTENSTSYDSDTSSVTAENSSLANVSIASENISEGEETILRENKDIDTNDSSGYVFNTITPDTVCQLTTDYLQSEHMVLYAPGEALTQLTPSSLSVVNKEAKVTNNLVSGDSTDTSTSSTTNSHSREENHHNAVNNHLWNVREYHDQGSGLMVQPADYVLPTLCRPQVFFSFPED